MKKEKLKELGLTEEQIRAVLDENSRDLQKARDKDAAAKLWEEERAALVYNEYEISEEHALEAVQRFCKSLQEEGVLEHV